MKQMEAWELSSAGPLAGLVGDGPQLLYRQLVECSPDLVITVDPTGVITFANEAATFELGHRPGGLLGVNALDLVHPDDLDRALADLASQNEHGAPKGSTSFRLRHTSGRWLPLDITASDVHDGDQVLLALAARPSEDRRASEEVVLRLLRGASRAEQLQPVLDLFAWQANGSQIGITWQDPDGAWRSVSTGLPAELLGHDDLTAEPWASARRDHEEVHGGGRHGTTMGATRLGLANMRGLVNHWVVPVPDVDGRPDALITVWTGPGGEASQIHAYGMSVGRTFVELILRWASQVERLGVAANTDDLTQLANRRAFFDRLDEVPGGGSILYADLDRFKAVNDAWGHSAGDEVLRQAGERIARCARGGGRVVARLGGDEFAVLCPDADPAEAEAVAACIRAGFVAPFAVGVRSFDVGISVGVAHAPVRLSHDTLEAADRALYAAKAHAATYHHDRRER